MLSCAIDAKENRYVVVSDIPGGFLHVDMEENINMLLEGTVAEMIIKLDPTIYRKHTWYNKHGKPMLYLQLKKEKLLEWGLTLNPNKNMEGKQCTIIWHVDDLKISLASKDVVEDILKKLNDKFGQESPLTMCRRKVLVLRN